MTIAQIVLSDLHLGARDSLLTHVLGGGEIAREPSPVRLTWVCRPSGMCRRRSSS